MKKSLIQLILSVLLALALTSYLYWPIYQKIDLTNSTANINTEIQKLNLPIGDDIKEILNRTINFPPDRFQLCLENKNRVYLIDSDSNAPGMPFVFHTDDIGETEFSKKNKVGAMTIYLYDVSGLTINENYREIGQPTLCKNLDEVTLNNYASSTVEYHHVFINQLAELDLGTRGKIQIMREVVGASLVDTSNSSAYIIPRWPLFFLTLFSIAAILFGIINRLWKGLIKNKKESQDNKTGRQV